MYFRIMDASSGGIGIGYLERQPFARIVWLSRMAESALLRRQLDAIYAVNMGYGGKQQDIDSFQQRIDRLELIEPKTDVKKLDKYKRMQRDRDKLRKKKQKKRKRIKLKMKED